MAVLNLRKKYKDEVIGKLLEKYKYGNKMSVPMLKKIVLNRGVGEAVNNSKSIQITMDQMWAITGQKPVVTLAKKSISNFKIREDQPIGCKVTLRSTIMYDFLTKLVNICMPKIRDFRGVPGKSFDGRGNYTFGLKEDIIFPEVVLDKIDQVRGFDITLVTSANTDEEAYDLLAFLGMPFRKN
jgi:large subunit ribosomal protein L5